MSPDGVAGAQQFIAGIDLAGVPTHGRKHLGPTPPRFIPRADEEQAVVVGSQVQMFAPAVDEMTRRSVANAMLLAQLVANKHSDDNKAWYQAYFDTLGHIGLITEERGQTLSRTEMIKSDVEKVVLELAASLLGGPATAAYQMVVSTLKALQKLDEGSPAVTIFRRETHHEAGHFQVSVTAPDPDGLVVSLLAFALDASATLTQVLFFKHKDTEAQVRHLTAKLGVNHDALSGVAPLIAQKVADYTDGYVRQIQI